MVTGFVQFQWSRREKTTLTIITWVGAALNLKSVPPKFIKNMCYMKERGAFTVYAILDNLPPSRAPKEHPCITGSSVPTAWEACFQSNLTILLLTWNRFLKGKLFHTSSIISIQRGVSKDGICCCLSGCGLPARKKGKSPQSYVRRRWRGHTGATMTKLGCFTRR